MRDFLKLALLFLAFMATMFIEPTFAIPENTQTNNYIQSTQTETVELVANNILNGEISSWQENDSPNCLGSTHELLANSFKKNIFTKNNPLLRGRFIHNLSTNIKEIHQIRAP